MNRIPPLECIEIERGQQDGKWGEQNHPDQYWMGILGEEFGEVCKAVIEAPGASDTYTLREWDEHVALLRYELVQVAAVAVSWIEAIDRRNTT